MRKVRDLLKTPAGKSVVFLLALFIVSLIGYTLSFGYESSNDPPPPPPSGDPCDVMSCDSCYSCNDGFCSYDVSSCPPETCDDVDCAGECEQCFNGQCVQTTDGEREDGTSCSQGGLASLCNAECFNIGSRGSCISPLTCVQTSVGGRCRSPENPTSSTCCNSECFSDNFACGDPLQCSQVTELGETVQRCRRIEDIDDENCSYTPVGCAANELGYIVGDINGDGVVDDGDWDKISSSDFIAAADVNGDYVVNSLDADRIYGYLLSGNDTSIGQLRCHSACGQLPNPSVGGGNIGDITPDYFLPSFTAASGFVTEADALRLNDFLNNRGSYVLQETLMNKLADLDGNGAVDEDDLILLKSYLSVGSPSGKICDVTSGVISEPTLVLDVTPDNQRSELSWSPIIDEIGYDEFIVTRSLCSREATFYDRPIDEVVYRGPNSYFNDSGLVNGSEYCYSLFAYRDINGVNDYSLPAFIQSTPGCYVNSVSSITLTSVSSGVFVRWSPVAEADGYQLLRDDNNNDLTLVYQGDGIQFVDNLAQKNQGNGYYLKAYKESGCLSEVINDTIFYQYDIDDPEVPARLFTPSFFADNGGVELSFSGNVVNVLADSILTVVAFNRDIYTVVDSVTAVIDGTSYPMFYDSSGNRYVSNIIIESVGELSGEIILIAENGETDSLAFRVMSWPQGEVAYSLEDYPVGGEFDLLIYDINGNLVITKSLYVDYDNGERLQAELEIPQTVYFYAQGSAGEYSQHSLTAFELLESGNVRVEVRSVPVEIELEYGMSQLVDIDGDGTDDIKVNYVSIDGESIILDIENLFEARGVNYQGEYGLALPNGEYKLVVASGDEEILVKDVTVNDNVLNDDIVIKRKGVLESAFSGVFDGIGGTLSFVADSAGTEAVLDVIDNPIVEVANERYVAPAVVGVALVGTIAAIPWWSLLHYLQILFVEPFALLFKKKRKGWGVIYNSLTKEPIDLAVIRLYNKNTDQLVKSKITNKKGQYNFLVNEGEYYIKVVKPNFDFPSKILAEVSEDKQFVDIYHGGTINIAEGKEGVIIANIPIDTSDVVESDKKIVAKKRRNNFGKAVSSAGPLFSVVSLIVSPSWLVGAFFVIHVLLFILFRRLAAVKAPKSWGVVYDKAKNSGMAKAVVRIFSAKYNKVLEVQVTNGQGQYGFITNTDADSVYYITSNKEGYREYKSDSLDMSKKDEDGGVISEDIYMEQ
jgi:hypothetical protein